VSTARLELLGGFAISGAGSAAAPLRISSKKAVALVAYLASDDFSFSFTYTVNGDGSRTSSMVAGSYSGTFTNGPRTGQTYFVDQIPPVTGIISEDGQTLIAAHTIPVVETNTYSNGDVWPAICHRSRVFIKLRGGDDDDHGGDQH